MLIALLTLACSARHTLIHDERRRSYHLFVPDDAGPGAPLVIALHGGGGTGRALDRFTGDGVTEQAAARGWVVAFPQGIARGWNDGRTLVTRRDAQRAEVDDVGFLIALIDELAATRRIDPERVFVLGVSNGGLMAYRLGVEATERFAAIAPVIANHPAVWADGRPAGPLPVLVMNGTADPLVPYDGGTVRVGDAERGEVLSTDETIAWWARNAGCSGAPESVLLPDSDPGDGMRVVEERWMDCAEGAEVTLIQVSGGGHTWPGGQQYLPESWVGPVTRDIDGAEVIFSFFDRH